MTVCGGTCDILYVDVLMSEPLIYVIGLWMCEVVAEIPEPMHCVLMTITPSLFIGFEHVSNEWKHNEVNYVFGIGNFLRLNLD
jgi:hypothetical protein